MLAISLAQYHPAIIAQSQPVYCSIPLFFDGLYQLGAEASVSFLAHVGSEVKGIIMARKKSAVTRLRLCAHSNMALYWSKNHLLTPRKGRKKFRTPVQMPSIVLLWTSRMPSPSSS